MLALVLASVVAEISSVETLVAFGVGFLAALAGAIVYEPFRLAFGAKRARRPPLRRYYWQITYRAGDRFWKQLWSIELVEVYSRGNRVWGHMYRVYPTHFGRRWSFEGRLHGRRHLSLIYDSVGDDYGGNGTINLGNLNRWTWSGLFQQVPEIERGIELGRQATPGSLPQIGPDFSEECLIEWVAADHIADDPVRGFLAAIPEGSPVSPSLAAHHLPARLREVLLQPPPFPIWFWRGGQAAAMQVSLAGPYAYEQHKRQKAEPRPWVSPTRQILQIDERDERSA